ncbi:hypothetical protein [Rosenbergiella epipactidis]|uniref:hypothetical protein n=1 Tax=Rosenbergiella epipactidis TaxID=1544694 RepID=UPI001F4F0022|nr:hypothetical protein [Rosenbergiella epipactidis]
MSNIGWKRYPQDVVGQLFLAVENNDVINSETAELPLIQLGTSQQNIQNFYALCLQFWSDGFTREELLSLINILLAGKELTTEQHKRYKYIRARYKHLRFAQRLYSQKHDADKIFKATTVYLGHLQDGFKNADKKSINYYGRVLRLLLSRPAWNWVKRSLENLQVDNQVGFEYYVSHQIKQLTLLLDKPNLTGTQFHDMRKIVSQQVSFFDTWRSIENNPPEVYAISRFLANINGLMGQKHDEMVADKLSGTREYETPTPLDSHIRECLEQLVGKIVRVS